MGMLDRRLYRTSCRTYRLEELCDILTGENINKADTNPDGPYPVYSGGVEPMGYADKTNRSPGIVIVSIQGSAGHVSYSWDPCWQSSFNAVLIARPDMIRPRFLYHVVKHTEPLLISRRLPSMVPSISLDILRSLRIKIPVNLMEQQRISDALDEFEDIHNRKCDGVEKLRRLFKQRNDAIRDTLLTFAPMP